nr:MAG TPA: hypothetical protein [Caudoviricetes sp.]
MPSDRLITFSRAKASPRHQLFIVGGLGETLPYSLPPPLAV